MAAYEPELADRILRTLNKSYPQPMSLSALQDSFGGGAGVAQERSVQTVQGLHEEGFVDCTYQQDGDAWTDIARISLTRRGRSAAQECARFEELGDLRFEHASKRVYDELMNVGISNMREQFSVDGIARSSSFVHAVSEAVFQQLASLKSAFLQSYVQPTRKTELGISPFREAWLTQKWHQVWDQEIVRAQGLASNLAQTTGFSAADVYPITSTVATRARELTFDFLQDLKVAVVEQVHETVAPSTSATASVKRADFTFLNNEELVAVLERDYAELQRLDPETATKAVLVMSGTIIEGLILDATVSSGKWSLAEGSKRTLNDLVNAALTAQILKHDRLTHAAKQYRNLVHPGREIRENIQFSSADAVVAKGAVDIAIREVREWYEKRRVAANSHVASAG
jgi:hypothetical protein